MTLANGSGGDPVSQVPMTATSLGAADTGEEWIAGLESVSEDAHRLVAAAEAETVRSGRRLAEISQLVRDLDYANEERSAAAEFVSRVSDEMRPPLTALFDLGELLAGSDLDEAQRTWAAGILRASRHVLGLLDEVGDLPGPDDGPSWEEVGRAGKWGADWPQV